MSYPPALVLVVLLASCQTPPGLPPPVPAPERQTTASTEDSPVRRLEFKEIKPARPVIDADLSEEFLDIFKDSEECSGIIVYTGDKKTPPDFKVRLTVGTSDTPELEQEWLWTVLSAKRGRAGELRGTGNQTSAALAVRDMCTTVWEDLDPNHYKKPEPKK